MLRILPVWSLMVLVLGGGCSPPAGGSPDWSAIFVQDRMVEWRIDMTEEQWEVLWTYPVDNWAKADLTVDGIRYPSVGVHILGGRGDPKTSLRIRFDEYLAGQRFHGVKRVTLHRAAGDPSMIREALALSLMTKAGIPAPRTSFVWVVKHGVPWGVFTLVEQIDKKFLEDRFAEDTGNLYQLKRVNKDDILDGDPLRQPDLVYLGDDPSLYDPVIYELKTNEVGDPFQDLPDLIAFMKVLNKTSAAGLEAELEKVLDLDGCLRWLAVNTWLSSLDSYPGTGGNLYLYHHSDGRYRVIPWDLNQAFANHHGKVCEPDEEGCTVHTKACSNLTADQQIELDPDSPTCGQPRPLVDRLLRVSSIKDRHQKILKEFVDGVLSPSAVQAEMEAFRARVREPAKDDLSTEFSLQEFEASFAGDIALGRVDELVNTGKKCSNGFDDDKDGKTDAEDPGCLSAYDDDETDEGPSRCKDGIDNDGDGWSDAADPDCWTGTDEVQRLNTECSDGQDNDGDGLTDRDDPDCLSAPDETEFTSRGNCRDRTDSDNDGWTDAEDPDCGAQPDATYRYVGLLRFIADRDAFLRQALQ